MSSSSFFKMRWLLLIITILLQYITERTMAASHIRGRQSIFRQEDEHGENEDGGHYEASIGWLKGKKPRDTPNNNNSNDLANTDSTTLPPQAQVPTSSPTVERPAPWFTNMSAEQEKACAVAASGLVYTTETPLSVRFLYELVSPENSNTVEVASVINDKVQRFLLDELIPCDDGSNTNQLFSIAGVGPGEDSEAVVKDSCSNLSTEESQVCNLMTGSVVLYLFSSDGLEDDTSLDVVSEKLRLAFNGEQERHRRSLESILVDENEGILDLHYIGDYVYEDDSMKAGTGNDLPVSNVGTSPSSSEQESRPSSVIFAIAITTALLVACFIFVCLVMLIHGRRKQSRRSKGVLLKDDQDSTSRESDDTFKEHDSDKLSLRFSVVPTEDESSSSLASSMNEDDEVVAANERVIARLTTLRFYDSSPVSTLSNVSSPSRPVFVDPNLPTYYSRSKTRYSFERSYSVDDTVEI